MSVAEQTRNAFEDFMDSVCDAVRPEEFNTWFSKVSGRVDDGLIVLSVPNKFVESCIRSRYENILFTLAAEMKMGLEISGAAYAGVRPKIPAANINMPGLAARAAPDKTETDSYSFDNFMTSAENEFAVAACKKLATGSVGFSPLFLYGPNGCGKTHLARAVRNEINSRGERTVVMLSGDRFVSDFLRSLQNKTNFEFKDRICHADVLIIDGVNALAGKTATIAEFESLLVRAIENGANVVLTAEHSPSAISGITRRLQSILSSGVVADVSAPNAAAKAAILRSAGAGSDVAEFIANNSDDDGHVLAGISKKISVWKETFGTAMSLAEAGRVLGDSLSAKNSPEDLVRKMCGAISISFDEIISSRRHAKIVRARQMMMSVLKTETNLSLSEIGRVFGGKDHATVIYAINAVEKQMASDLMLASEIEMLRSACRN